MGAELNAFEKAVLPTFRALTRNNISKEELVKWTLSERIRLSFDVEDINWLKIAIAVDSKKMVDAIFGNQAIPEYQINDAFQYAIIHQDTFREANKNQNLEQPAYLIERLKKSPEFTVANEYKDFSHLTTFDYFKEKMNSFLSEKSTINNKIKELREKFNSSDQNKMRI